MTQLYEGMFLLDNQVVRADWRAAKATVTDLVKKHGGEVLTARRWDERKLAYPISHRKRATFLLTYFNSPPGAVATIRRDVELDERVLRYLMLKVELVPDSERELSQAELAEGFSIPPPPQDDEVAPEPAAELVPAEAAVAETVPPEELAEPDETPEKE